MSKRGFVFTLDAIFAMLIALIMIVGVIYYVSDVDEEPFIKQGMYKISLDTLAVLEKDSTFKNSVNADSYIDIQNYLDLLPSYLCANITIYNQSYAFISSVQKTGCELPEDISLTRRTFILDNKVYTARMRTG